MSFKEKRKSASSGVIVPKPKKAKIEHTQPPVAAASKSLKKFERKQQASTQKTKLAKSSSTATQQFQEPQKRIKSIDEKPVKVPRSKKPAADPSAEFEWDSDPIEESETGEESGDNDGVSWPSDQEEGEADGYDEPMEDEGNQEDDELESEQEHLDEDGNGEDIKGGVNLTVNARSSDQNAITNGTSSRESHIKQKELLKERKAAKPNADEIARSKKLWERLRRASHVPKDERKKLIAELFGLITGRVREFVLKHDAGRVIQTALKYGTQDQRRMIARELSGEMANLAEGKYAKFMIGKLVSYGDKDIRDLVIPDFYGRVRKLIRHPEASWILDDIYRGAATKEQKARLLREWYGPEFALFADKSSGAVDSADLVKILSEHPEKRKHIMRFLWETINLLVQKKTTGFTMLHDAMLQYYLNTEAGSDEANEFLELLKGDEEHDLMKNLAFTPSGSRVVSLALAYGNAKDRKLLLRAYKDTMSLMAFDPVAHQVLIAACEVVDDTVLVGKSIFSELLPKDLKDATEQQLADAVALTSDVNAREVILMPFIERQLAMLRPTEKQMLEEIRKIRQSTSKKEPEVRKRELAKTLSGPLLQLIQLRASDLIQSSFGCIFVAEVIIKAEGDKSGALSIIAQLAVSEDESVQVALATSAGGKMLKTLVQGGRFDFQSKQVVLCEPRLHFVDELYDQVGEDAVAEWVTGPMTFVALAMLETQDWADGKKKEKLKKRLRKETRHLEELAKKAGSSKAEKSKRSKSSGAKDKKGSESEAVSNGHTIAAKGAKFILEALG